MGPGRQTPPSAFLAISGALPLKPGDQVRITAQLTRPAYIYVVWIDSQGIALPVYPWREGQWGKRPSAEIPSDRVTLPKTASDGWEIDSGSAGTESLLLLARETPLPADLDLAACFSGLARPAAEHLDRLVVFADGTITPDAANPERGPVLSKLSPINDSLLQTQRLIADRLRPLFPLVHPSPSRWTAARRSEGGLDSLHPPAAQKCSIGWTGPR